MEALENIEISDYKTDNAESYEGYVSESYDFYKESSADVIDNKIYVIFHSRLIRNEILSLKSSLIFLHSFFSNLSYNPTPILTHVADIWSLSAAPHMFLQIN